MAFDIANRSIKQNDEASPKPTLNKAELLKTLKADLSASETMQKEWLAKRETYRNETAGRPYGNETAGKSAIITKDIKKQLEWQLPSLAEPFLSTTSVITCEPVTFEDTLAARQNELLLNTQFCRKFPRYNFIMKALRILATEGTVIVRTGWDYEGEDIETTIEEVQSVDGEESIVTTTVTVPKTIINQPTATVCRNDDIFIDPTCMDEMSKCQFVVHRQEVDLSTLRADGRYKNLEKISTSSGTRYGDYVPADSTNFTFKDEPRKKLLMYEYWGNYDVNGDGIAEPIVCAWIDDVIVRLQSNPYPDGKPPFIVVPYNAVPFQLFGEALAETIGDNQKVKTAITRGLIDNMAKSNNAQIGMRKGALDTTNRRRFLNGDNFEYNGTPSDFWQGSYNQIPGSVFDMLSLQNNEIESQTGVKSFSNGISGTSLGNMLDIDTDIPMIDGSFKKLVDVEDGDLLVGSDGKATKVLKAHDVRLPEIAYDMEFDNGSRVKSGGEHLWTIKVFGTKHSLREWHTVDADTVYEHIQKGRRVIIPKIKELYTGTKVSYAIDPYVLGYWLGDGDSHNARITTADYEVVEYFTAAGYTCVEAKDSSRCGAATKYDVYKPGITKEFHKNGDFGHKESFHHELSSLNLLARYGGEKHIPEEFFTATYEEKMELIRGLMDSDGYAHSGSFVQFAQSEGRLKDDFIRLLTTLGLKADIRVKSMDEINKQNLIYSERTGTDMVWARRDAYEIGFTPWSNPFKLSRKAGKWITPRKNTTTLKSMKIVDKVYMRCLTVDSEDKLFAVTDKYTLTHNTATSARGAMDATATRRLSLVRNIAENLIKPLMRKWMSYNSEFLDEVEVIRVTNEKYVPVRRDDLAGTIDIDVTISTAEDNSARVQELSFLLQTMGPSQPFEINQMLMAKIAKLSRMPDLEKQLLEFKPKPDPLQEKLKELEIRKLEASIRLMEAEAIDLQARAGENKIDAQIKLAKAKVEEAKAKKISMDTNKAGLEFLMRDEGYDDYVKDTREAAERNHQLELVKIQVENKDNNIGIPRRN